MLARDWIFPLTTYDSDHQRSIHLPYNCRLPLCSGAASLADISNSGFVCSLVQEGPFPGGAMATRQMSVCTGVCFSITLDPDSISA